MENENPSKHDKDEVKSNTLIKFESVSTRQFSTLPAAVDLKRPPSNWLNGQIKFTPNMSNCYKFSSFKMAFDFWQELGEIDVISDSENIKNLLKLAYADNAAFSCFVHRIGNTLLIDQFDIQKYLLWKSEEDWKWLRSFIYEKILSQFKNSRRPFAIQHKSHEVVHQKNLLSKFLYYSIEDSSKVKVEEEKKYVPDKVPQLPLLPLPKHEDITELQDRHQFSRNILWTFEDIRMLIGSDMQIFGNASRPCISLRLRDMKKPINVLTGIDYWLDNLMCNVPEIFLCFHQDGIVQNYEHVKTEDLPHMENSKFSPKVIRTFAQNILSFLKSNATKSGHTYWLFKAKNDDVVKLYDLTTLQEVARTKDGSECDGKKSESENEEEDNNQNPFTIPVAMLLYNLARNLKYSKEKLTAKQAGNIKQLLDNCLKLLPKDKYPQIAISSHYILSDLQIQAGIDITNPSMNNFENEESDSDEFYDDIVSDDDDEVDYENECYSAMQSISDAMQESNGSIKKRRPQPLELGNIQERSKISLENVISGVGCLRYFGSESVMAKEKQKEKQQIIHEEQNQNMVNPEVAIPLGWNRNIDETKKSRKKSKRKESETTSSLPSSSNEMQINSKSLLMKGAPNVKTWNTHLKVLLYEKASLTYACLAEDSYNNGKFGEALFYLGMSIVCQNLVIKFVPNMSSQKGCLFGRVGDCYFQITKHLEKIDEFLDEMRNTESDLDREIIKELDKDEITKEKFKEPESDVDEMLEASCNAYEKSLSFSEVSKFELARRLGSVYNELGVHLMHKAEKLFREQQENENLENSKNQNYNEIANKSHSYLKKAVELFEFVQDTVNTVICNLNLGRFFRLVAHINVFNIDCPQKATILIQKKMYQESFDSYNKALAILVNRKNNPEVWDMVTWELSTATFTLAKQMQDNSTEDEKIDEIEREVLEMLMKSLKLCDLETNGPRHVLYCFRAGLIHHRIGSFYHQQLRRISDDTKKRTTLQICRLNYEKSINLLQQLKEFKEFFQVQLERIALQEFLAEETSNNQTKIKNYQITLNFFVESLEMLNQILRAKSIVDEDETFNLLELFEKRLQNVLKSLTKLTMAKKIDQKLQTIYKKMFSFTLRSSSKLEFLKLVSHLSDVLEKIQKCEFN